MMPTPSPERTPPKARHDMRLNVYANSIDDLADKLREIADNLEREQRDEPRNVASSRGYDFTIDHDPTMDEERFNRELHEWWLERKAKTPKGRGKWADCD